MTINAIGVILGDMPLMQQLSVVYLGQLLRIRVAKVTHLFKHRRVARFYGVMALGAGGAFPRVFFVVSGVLDFGMAV